jgi:hypothetical protein
VPASWRVLYNDGGNWKPVDNSTGYLVKKDTFNKVEFDAVKAGGIKIEIKLQDGWSAGVQEVIIE